MVRHVLRLSLAKKFWICTLTFKLQSHTISDCCTPLLLQITQDYGTRRHQGGSLGWKEWAKALFMGQPSSYLTETVFWQNVSSHKLIFLPTMSKHTCCFAASLLKKRTVFGILFTVRFFCHTYTICTQNIPSSNNCYYNISTARK
jgi:hypothetical protein